MHWATVHVPGAVFCMPSHSTSSRRQQAQRPTVKLCSLCQTAMHMVKSDGEGVRSPAHHPCNHKQLGGHASLHHGMLLLRLVHHVLFIYYASGCSLPVNASHLHSSGLRPCVLAHVLQASQHCLSAGRQEMCQLVSAPSAEQVWPG